MSHPPHPPHSPPLCSLSLSVNGQPVQAQVEPRLLLVEFLREQLRLSGTHIGCETSVCGACTVLLDGQPVKSCSLLAVQAEGAQLTTIEGLHGPDGQLHPVQQAFWEHHGLQCGFCTSGMVLSCHALLQRNPKPERQEIVQALKGNLCRCTGYQNILRAVESLIPDGPPC